MGPAPAGTVTPLMGPAAPATVTPLLGPADRGTMVSLALSRTGLAGQRRKGRRGTAG
jgi:hypothetical protein